MPRSSRPQEGLIPASLEDVSNNPPTSAGSRVIRVSSTGRHTVHERPELKKTMAETVNLPGETGAGASGELAPLLTQCFVDPRLSDKQGLTTAVEIGGPHRAVVSMALKAVGLSNVAKDPHYVAAVMREEAESGNNGTSLYLPGTALSLTDQGRRVTLYGARQFGGSAIAAGWLETLTARAGSSVYDGPPTLDEVAAIADSSAVILEVEEAALGLETSGSRPFFLKSVDGDVATVHDPGDDFHIARANATIPTSLLISPSVAALVISR